VAPVKQTRMLNVHTLWRKDIIRKAGLPGTLCPCSVAVGFPRSWVLATKSKDIS
jgi:hypothetical protein